MTDKEIEQAALKGLKKVLAAVKAVPRKHKHSFGVLKIPKGTRIVGGGICYGGYGRPMESFDDEDELSKVKYVPAAGSRRT